MKKNIIMGYTPQQIYNVLWKELNKVYIGDGLYIDIDSISIEEPYIKEHGCNKLMNKEEYYNMCYVSGAFGRCNEEDDTNDFNTKFRIRIEEGDTLDYIAGRFAEVLDE